jgi:hypothetical protein
VGKKCLEVGNAWSDVVWLRDEVGGDDLKMSDRSDGGGIDDDGPDLGAKRDRNGLFNFGDEEEGDGVGVAYSSIRSWKRGQSRVTVSYSPPSPQT